MAALNHEDLKIKAKELGVQFDDNTTYNELQSLVKNAKDATPPTPPETPNEPSEKTPAELAAESAAAQAKFNASRNVTPNGEKMYTQDEVKNMMTEVIRKFKDSENDADRPEEHSKVTKKVRLPRFQNKWVLGFKNMNTDPYNQDEVIYAFDVFDERQRVFIPWVTLVFDEVDPTTGTNELSVPLETAIKKSVKVECECLEVKTKDESYSGGRIHQTDEDGNPTDVLVNARVEKASYRYVVKRPDGKTREVGPEVVNW